jgi:hypothetical protein
LVSHTHLERGTRAKHTRPSWLLQLHESALVWQGGVIDWIPVHGIETFQERRAGRWITFGKMKPRAILITGRCMPDVQHQHENTSDQRHKSEDKKCDHDAHGRLHVARSATCLGSNGSMRGAGHLRGYDSTGRLRRSLRFSSLQSSRRFFRQRYNSAWPELRAGSAEQRSKSRGHSQPVR